MDSEHKDEGNGVSKMHKDHLIISCTFGPWHVHIAGSVETDALALAMLRQALDYYEARVRAASAVAMMSEMNRAAQDKALLDSLTKR